MSLNPWLVLLVPAVVGLVAWVVRATLLDRITKLEDALQKSAEGQGKRIGDLESWTVAHDAVESERRHVREDTRGVPVQVTDGRKGRR